jgi:hypothetical protein
MDKHDNSSKDRTPSPDTEKIIDEHARHLDEASAFDSLSDPDAGKSDEERALIVI